MKLIKFQVQNIEVPDDWRRPYYRTLEWEGMNDPVSIYDESITTMPMRNAKTVDYELVYIKDYRHDGKAIKEWKFYVNFEEAKIAMPLLEGIVNNQTKELKREKRELEVQRERLIGEVRFYEGLWIVRLYFKVKSLLSGLQPKRK